MQAFIELDRKVALIDWDGLDRFTVQLCSTQPQHKRHAIAVADRLADILTERFHASGGRGS